MVANPGAGEPDWLAWARMMIVTTDCQQHGHVEFMLEADERHVPPEYLARQAQTIE